MIIIKHRVNTIEDLVKTNIKYGVEIDLRDDVNGEIYLHHDPFIRGENFINFLRFYNHSFLILNIKSEGIEFKVIEVLDNFKIDNYFFGFFSSYDKKMIARGVSKIALRYSEFEGMEIFKKLSRLIQYAWIDSFEDFSLTKNDYIELKQLGYKICLVSPELQNNKHLVQNFKNLINKNNFTFDLVCSKDYVISEWEIFIGFV
jgi:hypothetical protein